MTPNEISKKAESFGLFVEGGLAKNTWQFIYVHPVNKTVCYVSPPFSTLGKAREEMLAYMIAEKLAPSWPQLP